jgi:hypothetical protein
MSSDIYNLEIVRKAYERYTEELNSYFASPKRLLNVIKDFINFVKSIEVSASSSLIPILREQIRIAKRIIMIVRIRYFIYFVYHRLVKSLINKLIYTINLIKGLIV